MITIFIFIPTLKFKDQRSYTQKARLELSTEIHYQKAHEIDSSYNQEIWQASRRMLVLKGMSSSWSVLFDTSWIIHYISGKVIAVICWKSTSILVRKICFILSCLPSSETRIKLMVASLWLLSVERNQKNCFIVKRHIIM